jgi:hypothetical protein
MVFSPPAKVKKGSLRQKMPEQTVFPLMTLVSDLDNQVVCCKIHTTELYSQKTRLESSGQLRAGLDFGFWRGGNLRWYNPLPPLPTHIAKWRQVFWASGSGQVSRWGQRPCAPFELVPSVALFFLDPNPLRFKRRQDHSDRCGRRGVARVGGVDSWVGGQHAGELHPQARRPLSPNRRRQWLCPQHPRKGPA